MADPNNPLTPRINEGENRLTETEKALKKNVIINGAFDFWQRGISNASVAFADEYSLADRFYTRVGGNISTRLFEQSTDIPTELQNIVDYSMHITATGTGTFNMRLGHKIESNFIKHLSNKTAQISFYIKQENIVSFDIEAYIPVVKDSHGAAGAGDTQILNLVDVQGITNTWSRYTYEIALGDVSNGLHLVLEWNGDNLATPDVHVAGLMLHEGEVASDFQRAGRDLVEEQLLCYRYFYRINPTLSAAIVSGMVFSNPNNRGDFHWILPAIPRTTPSWLINGNFVVYDGNGNASALASGQGVIYQEGNIVTTGFTTSVSMGGVAQPCTLLVSSGNASNKIEFEMEL